MTVVATAIFRWLEAAGGSVALGFIIAIALGICANTVLFVSSAVVVLERFSRARRRWSTMVLVTGVWAGVLGGLAANEQTFESLNLGWPGAFHAWIRAALFALAVLIVAQLVVGALLRFLRPRALAAASAVILGAGYALLVGGLDRLGYAVAPAVATVAIYAVLRQRRPRGAGAGAAERMAGLLAGVLVLGSAIPFFLPAPEPSLSAIGGSVLSLAGSFVVCGLVPLAAAGFLDRRGSAEWWIARRYLFAKRRQTFISVITFICVAGVAAGVWLIITVLSVMNGFERTWRDEIIGNRAHFTIQSPLGPIHDYEKLLSEVRSVKDVVAAAPYIDAEGMVRGESGQIVGVRVRGVAPKLATQVTDLRKDLLPGSKGALQDLAPRPGKDGRPEPGIIIGDQLASTVGVGVGDPLLLISPFGGPPTPLGPGPRLQRFRVAGIFKSSFFQYDEMFTYVDLKAAQDFRRVGNVVDGIEVRTTDYYRSEHVARRVEARIGFPYYTRDWKEYFPAFFQALKTERTMMFVLLTMIMVVAAFAIVVTLIMMIMEKTSDIAILKAMGASDSTIERIFAIEGTLIGLVGTVAGVVAGIAVTTQLDWVQKQIEAVTGVDTLPASVYQFSTLPWRIDPLQVAIVVTIAMVLALGATLLPSRHGARLDPAEALRYE